MSHRIRLRLRCRKILLLALVGLVGVVTQLVVSQARRPTQSGARQTQIIGAERLVSVQPLPDMGPLCEALPPSGQERLIASLQEAPPPDRNPSVTASVAAAKAALRNVPGNRDPVRTVRD